MNPFSAKTMAVARRELMQRVRTKWFLIGTLGAPILLVGIMILSGLLMASSLNSSDAAERSIGVVGEDDLLEGLLVEELLLDSIVARAAPDLDGLSGLTLNERFTASDWDYLLFVPRMEPPQEGVTGPVQVDLLARDNVQGGTTRQIGGALDRAVLRGLLSYTDVQEQEARALLRSGTLDVLNVSESGRAQSQDVFQGLSIGIATLFYMILILYGQMIVRAVLEEKQSNIVEVIVSSLRPAELMMGKIVGVGGVGLVQMAIWAALLGAGVLTMAGLGLFEQMRQAGVDLAAMDLPWFDLGVSLVMLVLGYLLYAGMFAGAGATVSTEADAGQVMLPIIMLIVLPFMAIQGVIVNPGATWAVVMSLIPFFSPLVMTARLLLSEVPAWEWAVALVLLVGGVAGMAWLAGRIFRVGILMKGQKANLPEVVRWIRHG